MAIVLALAGSALNAYGQSAGGATTPGQAPGASGSGGGAGRGFGGQHQLPSPEKMAEELLKKFDADSDGELSQTELTQALEALGEHHPHAGGGRRGRGGARPHGSPSGLGTAGAHGNSDNLNDSGNQGSADGQGSSDAQGANQERPSADEIAAHLIEKYSSDKKGLKADELANAIKEHRASRGQSEGQQTAAAPTGSGTP